MTKTPLRKTPIVGRFAKQLIQINDQVCYSSLYQWEFNQTLSALLAKKAKSCTPEENKVEASIPEESKVEASISEKSDAESYTPDVFRENPYAQSINRKIADLPTFADEAEQVALRMSLISSVEYMLAYIEDIQDFRSSLVGTIGNDIRKDAEEEQLELKLQLWSRSKPTRGYFLTFGYFRLLRNHYAHANEQPHRSLTDFVKSYGTLLEKFWDNGRTDTHGISFKDLYKIPLTPELAFGLMNVMRVCLLQIDDMVSNTITEFDATRYALGKITQSQRNRQLPITRLASKVKAQLEMEWNMRISLKEVESTVQGIIEAKTFYVEQKAGKMKMQDADELDHSGAT